MSKYELSLTGVATYESSGIGFGYRIYDNGICIVDSGPVYSNADVAYRAGEQDFPLDNLDQSQGDG